MACLERSILPVVGEAQHFGRYRSQYRNDYLEPLGYPTITRCTTTTYTSQNAELHRQPARIFAPGKPFQRFHRSWCTTFSRLSCRTGGRSGGNPPRGIDAEGI